MADYTISKNPSGTKLTVSKNSDNKVTITKNPGSTAAWFAKSGGTAVALSKGVAGIELGPELSPDLNFVLACTTGWDCTGTADSSTGVIPDSSSWFGKSNVALGMSFGTKYQFSVDIQSLAGGAQLVFWSGNTEFGTVMTTTGSHAFTIVYPNGGGTPELTIGHHSPTNGQIILNSASIREVL